MRNNRRPSKKLTQRDAISVWHKYWNGEFQNRIAAEFDVNPGRVKEIIKGKKFPESRDLALKAS